MRPINQVLLVILLIAIAARFVPQTAESGGTDAKHVVIVEESADRTAAQAQAFVAIQQGDELKRREAKGCVLEIIDQNDTNEKQRAAVVDGDFQGLDLPAILFYSKKNGKLLYKQSLGKDFTADAVIKICKGHGA